MTCAHDCRYFITIDYSKIFKSPKTITCGQYFLARPGYSNVVSTAYQLALMKVNMPRASGLTGGKIQKIAGHIDP